MKKIGILFLIMFGWALSISAQSSPRPSWINNPPKPSKKGNYYYRVTAAEGRDYESAYTKAFAMAVYESYSRLQGIAVSINSSESDIEKNIEQSISTVSSGQMRLRINNACHYEEPRTGAMGIKLYVLWQVANNALDEPKFDYYNKCDK